MRYTSASSTSLASTNERQCSSPSAPAAIQYSVSAVTAQFHALIPNDPATTTDYLGLPWALTKCLLAPITIWLEFLLACTSILLKICPQLSTVCHVVIDDFSTGNDPDCGRDHGAGVGGNEYC